MSLQVFTEYTLRVTACTVVGCAQSDSVSLSMAQLPPSYVQSPRLTVFGMYLTMLTHHSLQV